MFAECSPFSAYGRLRAGAVFIRVWLVDRGPKGGQSEGKEPQDEHSWGAGCVWTWATTPSQFISLDPKSGG